MARASYHHGDLANALVDVSLELVETRGLDEFSLREAAARCGVAVSSAYKHYESKGDLLHAVADRGFRMLGAQMERKVRASTEGLSGTPRAEAQLYELGRQYILFATAHPNLFRLMYGERGQGGAGDKRPDAPARRLAELLLGALDEVRKAYGRQSPPLPASMVAAWSIVHGYSVMIIDGIWKPANKQEFHAMIAELGQTIIRSLR
jgi:AcrR family transcriptional regulator